MLLGLRVFFSRRRIKRAELQTNVARFRRHFGVRPIVVCEIWEDLQTSDNPNILVPKSKAIPKYFLMCLHHLKRYPTEGEREGPWDIGFKAGSEWVKYFIERLQALKFEKIVFPNDFGDTVWILTVDGTHVWVEEPKHPEWSQDKDYYYHKYGKAGMMYELAMALSSSNLIWVKGPFPAGKNDAYVFNVKGGLNEKLLSIKKKSLGDKGYSGYRQTMSVFNAHDSRNVKKFKSRALHRQEVFNNMTKRFKILRGPFRHGVDSFPSVFEAVCVLCQYQMENGEPLYDILIEDIV